MDQHDARVHSLKTAKLFGRRNILNFLLLDKVYFIYMYGYKGKKTNKTQIRLIKSRLKDLCLLL